VVFNKKSFIFIMNIILYAIITFLIYLITGPQATPPAHVSRDTKTGSMLIEISKIIIITIIIIIIIVITTKP